MGIENKPHDRYKICKTHSDLLLEEYKQQSEDWRLRDSYVENKLSWVTAIFGLLSFTASGIFITQKIVIAEESNGGAINYKGIVSALIGNEVVTYLFLLIISSLSFFYIYLVLFSIFKDIIYRDGSETYLSTIMSTLLNTTPTSDSKECQLCKSTNEFKGLLILKRDTERLDNPRKIQDRKVQVGSTFNLVISYYVALLLISLFTLSISLIRLHGFLNKLVHSLTESLIYLAILTLIVSLCWKLARLNDLLLPKMLTEPN